MTTAELSSSIPAGYHSTLTAKPDADFEQRWTAWKARGLAHERGVRHRFIVVIFAAAVIVVAAVVAYRLLLS